MTVGGRLELGDYILRRDGIVCLVRCIFCMEELVSLCFLLPGSVLSRYSHICVLLLLPALRLYELASSIFSPLGGKWSWTIRVEVF